MWEHKVESVLDLPLLVVRWVWRKEADCSLSHVGSARPSSAQITVS